MLPRRRRYCDGQSKTTFDAEWAYNTSIALSSVFKAYPELDSNEVLVYEKSYVEDVAHYRRSTPLKPIIRSSFALKPSPKRATALRSRHAIVDAAQPDKNCLRWSCSNSSCNRWLNGPTLRDAPIEKINLGPVILEDMAAVEIFRQLLHPQLSGTPPPPQHQMPTAPCPETFQRRAWGADCSLWLECSRRCHDGPSTQRFLCLRRTRCRSQACRVG